MMAHEGRTYVHGYERHESTRLQDQASALEEIIHGDTSYPAESIVLEAGCGVGAQTVSLARNSPDARIISIDISAASLAEAAAKLQAEGLDNVEFRQADIFDLPFGEASFDHVFLCFVLEHLAQPLDALKALRPLVRPGGTITVIEGDHGSTFFHPENAQARAAIRAQVDLQRAAGGDPDIGRWLYPLLADAGFGSVSVSPRMIYADGSRPDLAESFTKRTFTAMIEGVREPALVAGLIEPSEFDAGIRALYRTAEADGVFCYTFFKAKAVRGEG